MRMTKTARLRLATWANVSRRLSDKETYDMTDRPCTCHPDDNPPVPCPQKYALSECKTAPDAATVELPPLPDIEQEVYARTRTFLRNDEIVAVGQLMEVYASEAIRAAHPAPVAAPAPCPVCHGEGIVLIGDGYSVDGCPACRPAAPAPDAKDAFERWWYASKYCQVPGYPEKEWRQIAWDGWQAAMKEKP